MLRLAVSRAVLARRRLPGFVRRVSSAAMSPVLPPAPRPDGWKAAAPPPPSGTTTFAAQASLPLLPVPPLAQTVAKLKQSLVPLAWNADELQAAHDKVDAFAAGVGKELQSRLEEHARGREHWLERWWDDGGYLGYRDSVIINVSYYYGFKDIPNTPTDHVHRAAALVRSSILFRRLLKRGELPPDGTRDAPFCMDTYRWMFDCARVPARPFDWSVSYARADDTGDSGHIVVVRNGRFWRVDLAPNGTLLSTADIARHLRHIVDHSPAGSAPGVGVLTASDRDTWADDYVELAADAHNRTVLADIHSAAFVLALDASTPVDLRAQSRELWHGNIGGTGSIGLETRWSDKPINLIVFDNGAAGIMGEHSVMDGTPTVTYCDTILNMLASPSFDHGAPQSTPSPSPSPLDFSVSEHTRGAIDRARTAARELAGGQAMGICRTTYGKAAIKTFGVSPDSWAQLVIQLAHARLLRATGVPRAGGTYEAATTRRFRKGRTETIRVISADSEAWVRAVDDGVTSDDDRRALLRAAAATHVRLAKEAGAGQGVDRHLLGLKKVLRDGEPLPDVFADSLVVRSARWVLSTSAVFSKHFGPYGWGEVVPDGFGVAYMTGFDDHLQYTVTSRTDMPNVQFVTEIERAATDMYNLFASVATKPRL